MTIEHTSQAGPAGLFSFLVKVARIGCGLESLYEGDDMREQTEALEGDVPLPTEASDLSPGQRQMATVLGRLLAEKWTRLQQNNGGCGFPARLSEIGVDRDSNRDDGGSS